MAKQWDGFTSPEYNFDNAVEGIQWGSTPVYDYDETEYHTRDERHDQFFWLFTTRNATDDLDWEIFAEASSIWINRRVTIDALATLVWRKLKRCRKYSRLTEEEVRARLARLH